MRYLPAALLVLACALAAPLAAQQEDVRFEAVDVYVDAGEVPLAAYQFELAVEIGEATLAGVEGGEPPAFASPPYYDPAALHQQRVIIAAFQTRGDLPRGRTRVARLHMRVVGEEPQYAVKLHVAAGADGKPVPAVASVDKEEKP